MTFFKIKCVMKIAIITIDRWLQDHRQLDYINLRILTEAVDAGDKTWPSIQWEVPVRIPITDVYLLQIGQPV